MPRTLPVVLELRGFHIPGKKNSKQIVPGKKGRRSMLITNPKFQKLIGQITESFESQLLSAIRTSVGATITTEQLRSWIASSLPEDDCWATLPEEHYYASLCAKGEEGCTITIERIA